MTPPTTGRPARSASIAVALSFIWPGLGQAYQRRYKVASLFAIPMVILVAYVAQLAAGGVATFALDLLDPGYAQAVLVVGLLAGAWRLCAMVEAWLAGRRAGSSQRLSVAMLVVLGAVALGAHGYLGYLTWAFYDAGSSIFVDSGDGDPFAEADPSGGVPPSGSANPTTPEETPIPGSSRISILLTGVDSNATRTHALTDTLMVVSVDPESRTGAMVSIPRDVGRFPLYLGGKYLGKINSLQSYARRHPDEFPDGPTTTLRREVGHLVGVPVPYYASVDLAGFVKLVDLVGGVTVNNTREIDDPRYGGWTDGRPVGFRLPVGKQTLDAQEALAFVRSRYGVGDSDFSRARRQQQLLLALRKKLISPEMLPRLPEVLAAAGGMIKTNFPASRLGEVLDLATEVPQDDMQRVVLGPGYTKKSSDPSVYMLVPDMKKFAKASVRLFGDDSRWYEPPAPPSASPSP